MINKQILLRKKNKKKRKMNLILLEHFFDIKLSKIAISLDF